MVRLEKYHTETMALIFQRQGMLEESAACYRSLLKKNPGSRRLLAVLAEIEARLEQKESSGYDLKGLMEKWVYLLECSGRGDDGVGNI